MNTRAVFEAWFGKDNPVPTDTTSFDYDMYMALKDASWAAWEAALESQPIRRYSDEELIQLYNHSNNEFF